MKGHKEEKAPHEQIVSLLVDLFRTRDWEQFHSPKNLVMNLGAEVGELLEHFRWMSEEQSCHPNPKALEAIEGEIADVFTSILYLAHKLQIDPVKASHKKIEDMKRKYPADQCRGKILKYTAYQRTED